MAQSIHARREGHIWPYLPTFSDRFTSLLFLRFTSKQPPLRQLQPADHIPNGLQVAAPRSSRRRVRAGSCPRSAGRPALGSSHLCGPAASSKSTLEAFLLLLKDTKSSILLVSPSRLAPLALSLNFELLPEKTRP